MIKVAIADDERMIREGLRDAFPWSEEGFELVGLCKNGLEAYEMAEALHPDIFLMDINMPKLSGLDLIEKIRGRCPEMIFIIISGYSEFDYAHRAIQLGVFNYIVKPIDENKLWAIISDAKASLIDSKQRDEDKDYVNRQLNDHLETLQKEFVRKLVTQGYDDSNYIEEELTHLQLDFGQTPGLLLIRHLLQVTGERKWSDQLLHFAYNNLLEEILQGIGDNNVICIDQDDQIIALFRVMDSQAFLSIRSKVESAAKEFLGQQCRVSSAIVDKDLLDISEVYMRLDQSLEVFYSETVGQVKRIVDREFSNSELDLNEIASRLSVSASHLSRQINKELGLNFKEYLIGVRMDMARTLISKSDFRFNEIAEKVGYSNQHYFTRSFKKVTGMTPSKYREHS